MVNDELWVPPGLTVRQVSVTLNSVDVSTFGELPGFHFVPGQFTATARVLIGKDGAGDPIWKSFEVRGASMIQVLYDLWATARASRL